MTMFHHKRIRDAAGNKLNRGGMTVAFNDYGGDIEYAIAQCHEKDNFSREQGRVKAAGRLHSSRYRRTFNGTKEDFLRYIETELHLF